MARLYAIALFWYDFIVGDDWKVAAGVVIGLAGTVLLSRTALPSWWVLPAVTALLLSVSIWAVARSARSTEQKPN
jgi:membrane protein implicated in regulation of membrane protease activity